MWSLQVVHPSPSTQSISEEIILSLNSIPSVVPNTHVLDIEASVISTSCSSVPVNLLSQLGGVLKRGVLLRPCNGVNPRDSSNLKTSARKSFHIRGVEKCRGSSCVVTVAVISTSAVVMSTSSERSAIESFLSCWLRIIDFLWPGLKKTGDPNGNSVGENNGDGNVENGKAGSNTFSSLSAPFANMSMKVGLSIPIELAEPLRVRDPVPDRKISKVASSAMENNTQHKVYQIQRLDQQHTPL